MNTKKKAIILSLVMIIMSNTVSVYAEKEEKKEITRERIIEEELSEGLRDELMDKKDVHKGYLDKKLIETSDLIIRGIEQYKLSTEKIMQLAILKVVAKKSFKEKYNEEIENDFKWWVWGKMSRWFDGEYATRVYNYTKFIDAYDQFKKDRENLKDRVFEGITSVIDIIRTNNEYKPISEILEKYETSKEAMSEEDTTKIKEFFEAKIKEVNKRERRIYDNRITEVLTEILKRRYHYMEEGTVTKLNTSSKNYLGGDPITDEIRGIDSEKMKQFVELIKEERSEFNYPILQKLSTKEGWNAVGWADKLMAIGGKAIISGLIYGAFGFNWFSAPMMFGDMLIDVVKTLYYTDEQKYELEKMYKTDSFVDSFFSKDRYIKRRESEIQRIIIYKVWKEEILKRRKDLTDKYIEEKIKEEEEYAEKERKNTGRRGITTSDVLQMIYIHKKVSRLENNISLEMINNIEKEIQENIDRLKETYKAVYKEGETHLLDLDYIKENLNLINLDKEFIIGGEKKIGTYKIDVDIKEWKQTYKDKEGNEIEIIEEEGKNKYYCGGEEVKVDTEGNVIKRNIGTKTEEELKRARDEAKERRRKEMIDKYKYCYYKYYELDKVMKEWKEIPKEMYFPSIKEIEEKNKTKYEIKDMEECRWKTYESDVSREKGYKWCNVIYEGVKTIGMGASLRGAPLLTWFELSPVLSTGIYNAITNLYDHCYFSNDCYKEIDYDREGYIKNIAEEILKEEERKLNLYRARTGKDGATREDIIELIVLKKMIEKKLENIEFNEIEKNEKCSSLSPRYMFYYWTGSKMPYEPNAEASYSMLKFVNKVLGEAREAGAEAGIDAYNIDIEDKYIKYDSMINIPASKYIQRESQKNLEWYNKWKWRGIGLLRTLLFLSRVYNKYKQYKAEEKEYYKNKAKYDANYKRNKTIAVLDKKSAENVDENGNLKNYEETYREHVDELKQNIKNFDKDISPDELNNLNNLRGKDLDELSSKYRKIICNTHLKMNKFEVLADKLQDLGLENGNQVEVNNMYEKAHKLIIGNETLKNNEDLLNKFKLKDISNCENLTYNEKCLNILDDINYLRSAEFEQEVKMKELNVLVDKLNYLETIINIDNMNDTYMQAYNLITENETLMNNKNLLDNFDLINDITNLKKMSYFEKCLNIVEAYNGIKNEFNRNVPSRLMLRSNLTKILGSIGLVKNDFNLNEGNILKSWASVRNEGRVAKNLLFDTLKDNENFKEYIEEIEEYEKELDIQTLRNCQNDFEYFIDYEKLCNDIPEQTSTLNKIKTGCETTWYKYRGDLIVPSICNGLLVGVVWGDLFNAIGDIVKDVDPIDYTKVSIDELEGILE